MRGTTTLTKILVWLRPIFGKASRISVGVLLTSLAIAQTLGFISADFIQRLDNMIYDLRLRAEIIQSSQPHSRIVIVDIDEPSLAKFGQWPWSRDLVSKMTSTLIDDYGAAVVGYDVVFAEPDGSDALAAADWLASIFPELATSIQSKKPQLLSAFDRDQRFAKTLTTRPVVLGYYFNQERSSQFGQLPAPVFQEKDLAGRLLSAYAWKGYGANVPVLANAAKAGFINPALDADGVVRSVPLIVRFGDAYYESLALAIYRTALNNPKVSPVFPEGTDADYGQLEYLRLHADDLDAQVPVAGNMTVLAGFRGTGGPRGGGFTYISAGDVLQRKVDKDIFRDRIVLVGTTAPGLMDLRSTPVNSVFPGVEVHANVLSGLLGGGFKFVPEYASGVVFVILFVSGVTLSFLMAILSPLGALITALAYVVLTVFVNWSVYIYLDAVYPLATTFFLVVGIFVFNVVFGYLSESYTRKAMVNLFGEYVAPELVTEMAKDPNAYSMEGENRELTVMFSDVRGFTTISESLSPQELREYINDYLTTMSEIIRRHRGTLDKYIGDAIMAFWGAPITDDLHAHHAVIAAMEMQVAVHALNAKFAKKSWPVLAIGVGLNTGNMRVGDMGSKIRRAYTVMGDAVNLASRLEGITKTYGVGVVVGKITQQSTSDFVYRELDIVRVKGKNEPVPIFEPIGLHADLSAETLAALQLWSTLLGHYRQQQWAEAEACCQQLLANKTEQFTPPLSSGLYALYAERIERMRANPPGPDWDGVTTFETK